MDSQRYGITKDSFSFHVEGLRHNVIFHLKVDKSNALAKKYFASSSLAISLLPKEELAA